MKICPLVVIRKYGFKGDVVECIDINKMHILYEFWCINNILITISVSAVIFFNKKELWFIIII